MGHDPPATLADASLPACPVCGEPLSLAGRTVVFCEDCAAPHHRRCWVFNRGCATYACACRSFLEWHQIDWYPQRDELRFEYRHGERLTERVPAFVVWPVMLAFLLTPAWIVTVVFLLAQFSGSRYRIVLGAGAVERELFLGAATLHRKAEWKRFPDVAELFVQPQARFPPELPRWDLYLRDVDGVTHLLGPVGVPGHQVRSKCEAAAEIMDTVISFPTELPRRLKVPRRVLQALSSQSPEELPDAPARPLPLEGCAAVREDGDPALRDPDLEDHPRPRAGEPDASPDADGEADASVAAGDGAAVTDEPGEDGEAEGETPDGPVN